MLQCSNQLSAVWSLVILFPQISSVFTFGVHYSSIPWFFRPLFLPHSFPSLHKQAFFFHQFLDFCEREVFLFWAIDSLPGWGFKTFSNYEKLSHAPLQSVSPLIHPGLSNHSLLSDTWVSFTCPRNPYKGKRRAYALLCLVFFHYGWHLYQ